MVLENTLEVTYTIAFIISETDGLGDDLMQASDALYFVSQTRV